MNQQCDNPKVKDVLFVSNYMLKKYGVIGAFERAIKRKNKKWTSLQKRFYFCTKKPIVPG